MTIEDWANTVLEDAKRNLSVQRGRNNRRTNATGRLRDSLKYRIENERGFINIVFYSDEEYSNYIHDGVKGADSTYPSASRSPHKYSKKTRSRRKRKKGQKSRPTPFVLAIEKWMADKPVRIRSKSGRFAKKTKDSKRQAAYVIRNSIISKGIRANPYFDDAIDRYIDLLDDVDFDIEFLIDDLLEDI